MFEYMTVPKPNPGTETSSTWESKLDEYGSVGWELVAVDDTLLYFKRAIKRYDSPVEWRFDDAICYDALDIEVENPQ